MLITHLVQLKLAQGLIYALVNGCYTLNQGLSGRKRLGLAPTDLVRTLVEFFFLS